MKEVLDGRYEDSDDVIRGMIKDMKEKFDKYWKDANFLMAIAAVLDPRYKMAMVKFVFGSIYPKDDVEFHVSNVRTALTELYNEYKDIIDLSCQRSNLESRGSSSSSLLSKDDGWSSKFYEFVQSVESVQLEKSELETLLEEGLYRTKSGDASSNFDCLDWWRSNELKYRILSQMACDILAIPVSTVASESTFSAGSRVIDHYRSKLSTETVQALICGGDWIRKLHGKKKKSQVDEEPVEIPLPQE